MTMPNDWAPREPKIVPRPVCCLCGGPLLFWGLDPESPYGYGNNPDPLGKSEEDRCCGDCNDWKVIPARLRRMT